MASADELQLTILAAENRHSVRVPSSTTIADLRRLLSEGCLREVSVGKTLRLIAAGRVLSDDRSTLRDSRVSNNAVIHVAMTERPGFSAAAASSGNLLRTAAGSASTSVRSSAVGVAAPSAASTSTSNTAGSVAVDDVAVDVAEPGSQASNRRGFDRLRSVGLNDEDISLLRLTYQASVIAEMGPVTPLEPGETEASRLLRMEEAWMQRQDPFSEFAINVRPLILSRLGFPQGAAGSNGAGDDSEGDDGPYPYPPHAHRGDPALGFAFGTRSPSSSRGSDDTPSSSSSSGGSDDDGGNFSSFLCGVALGSAVGFIMLLWLTSGAFSRKFRVGIVVGVCINLAITLSAPSTQKSGSGGSGSRSPSAGGDAGGDSGPGGPLSAWSRWGGFLGPVTATAAGPLAKYLTPWA